MSASFGYGSKQSNGQKLSQSVSTVRLGNKRLKVEPEVSKTSGARAKEVTRGRGNSGSGTREE